MPAAERVHVADVAAAMVRAARIDAVRSARIGVPVVIVHADPLIGIGEPAAVAMDRPTIRGEGRRAAG